MHGTHGRVRAYQVEHLSASGRMRVIGWWERRGSWFVNIAMSCCERVYGWVYIRIGVGSMVKGYHQLQRYNSNRDIKTNFN
jgi:hypothetical protein